MSESRGIEKRRLFFMVIAGLVLGYLTGYWIISQWIASLLFIGWMLFKLCELQNWLETGRAADKMPDSDGVWGQITYTIHRTQREYDQHKQNQQDSLLRFNNIMAAMPDAKILLNTDHVIQWANQSTLELLGIDPERDTGQRIDNLIRKKKFTKLLNNTKNVGKTLRIKSPHDDNISLRIQLLPVQPGLNLLSVRNISQQTQLNNMRQAFIANASHELRTPLTVLSGYLELFDDDPELPAHLKPAIEQAREQSERMQVIINDMLKLSQLESGGGDEADEHIVDIPAIINSTATALQKTIAADSHTLSLDIDNSIKIRGTEKDITSVITNLLANAIKHTPPGSHIKANWQRGVNGNVSFSVEDDGPGIPQEHLEHLTDRFYRVDSGRSRDKGGTGLGLAIVKHTMLNHDGSLLISSEPGKTVFTAKFPEERVV